MSVVPLLLGYTGFGKTRHAGVAGERSAHHVDRECGARCFAEAHAEVEQRLQAEFLEQPAVTGLGGGVGGQCMREPAGAEPGERCGGSRADETVEQERNAVAAGGERRAEDRGQLAAADRYQRRQRICNVIDFSGLSERAANQWKCFFS